MIYSAKQLAGNNDESLGKWVKVTPEEFQAVQDSMVGENYARGAVQKPSLRLYYQDGYAVVCTSGIDAQKHPEAK